MGRALSASRPGLTFAHEIGHNQGAEHHPADPQTGAQAYAYSFGHRFRDRTCFIFCGDWRYYATVMAYRSQPGETNTYNRIGRFSNPDVVYSDQRTGIDNERDNARTLENTAVRMANLYVNRFSSTFSYSSPVQPYAGDYSFYAVTGGTEPAASYEWFVSTSPFSYGSAVSSAQSFTQSLPVGTWYVKLIAQSTAGSERTSYATVDVQEPAGPGDCSDPTQECTAPNLVGASASVESVASALSVTPNPVRGSGRVVVRLREDADVSVGVYDVLGREVYRVASERRSAGEHVFAFDGSGLPPGVYTVRLMHGGAVETRQVSIVR